MITFFAEAFVWARGVSAQCIDVTLIMITITFIEIWKERRINKLFEDFNVPCLSYKVLLDRAGVLLENVLVKSLNQYHDLASSNTPYVRHSSYWLLKSILLNSI